MIGNAQTRKSFEAAKQQEDSERLERYKAEAQAIRAAINSTPLNLLYRLEKSKNGLYVCPICGSGTLQKKTGALSISKSCRVVCFSGLCFQKTTGGGKPAQGTDTMGALRILMPEKTEREIFAYCGYEMTGTGTARIKPRTAETAEASQTGGEAMPAQEERHDFTGEIERYAADLAGSEGEAYLTGRGFTQATLKRFKFGYDAQRRCVTYPYSPKCTYYGRRFLDPESSATKGKYDKLKADLAGREPLFNALALYSSDIVFVTEGAFDAVSIAQAGGAAVALNGTGFAKLVDQLKKRPTAAALVLCLDNDAPGRDATIKLDSALEELGVFHVDGTAAIMGAQKDNTAADYRKDANEVLQRDGAEALQQAVTETADETRRALRMIQQDAEEERQRNTGAEMVESFLQAIQSRQYEPMPTGITDIDAAIGGGFIRQQLVLLGAAPGAGKTALAQWIFEGMAKRGVASCVYLNLEMSREQILARSFARIAARQGFTISTTSILQGYRWTEAQRAAIMDAAAEYKTEIAPKMVYNPDGVTANLDSILEYIEAEAQRAEQAQQAAPCIVLDYLQIISGDPREDAATVIKRAVFGLKEYAMRHNTVVFLIIAHNRQSNSTGKISMESGRDTSALEYSADLQLALTYTKCLKRDGKAGKDPDELTQEEKRQVTLRIVKGRFGGAGREVDLVFDGETMTYTQTEKAEQRPRTRF